MASRPKLTISSGLDSFLSGGDEAFIKMHEAMLVLQHADPRLARVVELRYFRNHSVQEISKAPELTERTVKRDWNKARRILLKALKKGVSEPGIVSRRWQ